MSELETSQAVAVTVSRAPAVGVWDFPRKPGISVSGGSRITFTNITTTEVRVRIGDRQADLPARGLLTLPLDTPGSQLVLFETASGGRAGGFFVLHDTISDWQVPGVGAETETPFQGPISLALVNHPSSAFVVECIVDGGVRARVAPGEIETRFLTESEARSMTLLGLRNITGEGSAQGVFCALTDDDDR